MHGIMRGFIYGDLNLPPVSSVRSSSKNEGDV